mmetsp:Transcript_3790/g.12595  ORF Transcript_3790/g.12595 Transcript_3790/m.12595 type:complete len:102 (+) Transcript_3790:44-349(+)
MNLFCLVCSATAWTPLRTLAPRRLIAVHNHRPPYIPGKIVDPGYVRIFDTTLRDGEQSPGATLTSSRRGVSRFMFSNNMDYLMIGQKSWRLQSICLSWELM